MKSIETIEPRSLLSDSISMIDITPDMIEIFNFWKKKFEEKTNKNPEYIDYMYAGYILANPIVREQFKKEKLGIKDE